MTLAKFVMFALTILPLTATAQNNQDLDKLDQKFIKHFERVMPGWKHERVEPVYKNENVLIQFWSVPHRKVKISIIPRKSAQEAREILQRDLQLNRKRLTDVGDEAFSGGYGDGDIAFRRGRFTVYIRTHADVDSDPDARTLSQPQRFEREKSERRRLSIEFAKHAANAVDAP